MTLQFNNKTLAFTLCSIIASMSLLQSCHGGKDECSGKQVTCPSFDNPLALQWLPYSVNQQLIYTSTNAKSDTFTMRSIDLSKSFSSTVSGNQPDCVAQGNWQTNPYSVAVADSNLYFRVQQSIDQYTSSQSLYTYLQVKNFLAEGAGFADTGLIKDPSIGNYGNVTTSFQLSLILAGKTFNNVQAIQIDTTNGKISSGKVYKIYIAKNIGLVGYQNYPSNNLWVKQ